MKTDGAVVALQYPYELEGGVLSAHAADDTGFATANCAVVLERDAALLIDTGFTVHRELLLDDLCDTVGEDRTLSILPLRMGEMNSICNVRSIVSSRPVQVLYGNMGDPASLVDFLPQDVPFGTPPRHGVMADLDVEVVRPGSDIAVGASGERVLRVLTAPLQLLPFSWVYDPGSGTLFTSDVFAYRRREFASGPWVVSNVSDMAPDDDVYRQLTHSRYWWLAGADTRAIVADLTELFSTLDVRTIFPAFGCVLRGADVVNAHVEQLFRVLGRASRDESVGVAAGRWRNRPVRTPGENHV
ncbi:MBL fold metallo-hydrolase [Rhodococcus artemisiae]|uniref:Metallo-beta-lactamase superfamily protein n=1 Tax=Rhodococcus artemisiae TaxID=714159 RepID=A0ABU7LGR4_9NOCA|nr:hypothetical protein [Rhodococcus artemisiae]MEE2060449.1 hypothetical protein [Rhodococcus artemisiae]